MALTPHQQLHVEAVQAEANEPGRWPNNVRNTILRICDDLLTGKRDWPPELDPDEAVAQIHDWIESRG